MQVLKIRYEQKMRATEDRMRQLGLLTPTSVLTLDEWEIPRDRVVINRKLGEGAFGTVYGGETLFDEKGWVSLCLLYAWRLTIDVNRCLRSLPQIWASY